VSHGYLADAGSRVEPGAERVQRAIVREHRAPGEADCRTEELAALVEHGYSMMWSARRSSACGMVRPRAFAVFVLMTNSNWVGWSTGRSAGFHP
jgi:hypothetical protein